MANLSYDVITIGAATLDIFIKSEGFSIKPDASSPSGQTLCLPFSNKLDITQGLVTSGGGATNACLGFNRLGFTSAPISLIGQDEFGQLVLSDLKKYSIPTDFLTSATNDSTDYSVILVGPDGGRTVLVNRGHGRLDSPNIPWDKLKTKHFYITSLEGNIDLLEQILGFSQENNITVTFNPGNLELSQSAKLWPLLAYVDILLVNQIEAELLTGLTFNTPEFWQKIEKTLSKTVAVTNGRDGAYILSSGQSLYSPIINTNPVDETGAGDSFGCALAAGILSGCDLTTSLSWAMHNAASVVGALGAKDGLLTKQQLSKALQ